MQRADVTKCLYLLGSLWNNYKPIEDPIAAEIETTAWLGLLGNVKYETVQNIILEIASEGGKFAPQVGEIYKRLKDKRDEKKQLEAHGCDEDFYYTVRSWAIVVKGLDKDEVPPITSFKTSNELLQFVEKLRKRDAHAVEEY